jgi:hypothetical protein
MIGANLVGRPAVDDYRFWLSLPIVTAALTALVPLAVPTHRWSKSLARDVEIFASMPDGREREELHMSIDAQARRIREYRTEIPPFLRMAGWVSSIALLAALSSALLFGTDVNGLEWTLVGLSILGVIVFLPVALWGWMPFRFRAGSIESERLARTRKSSSRGTGTSSS